MYHQSLLGSAQGIVAPFADLRGYVPEEGDAPSDLVWEEPGEGGSAWDEEDWRTFVHDAVAATEAAQALIERWRRPAT